MILYHYRIILIIPLTHLSKMPVMPTPPKNPTQFQKPYYELRIFIDDMDVGLNEYYRESVNRQQKLVNEYATAVYESRDKIPAVDAGIDLFIPEAIDLRPTPTTSICKVNHRIMCAMYFNNIPCGFYMYPRSSLSGTPLRLANSVGIIDAGYRGDIMAKMDIFPHSELTIPKYTRLVQICSPNLTFPILPVIVDTIDKLGCETVRGNGGFGSTGGTA